MKTRAALLMALAALPATAAEPPPIRNNPFARPPATIIENAASAEPGRPARELIVIATMVSSTRRTANVDGRMLEEGDQIYGFRLVRIYEDRAVFERNGETETVLVKPERDENNERDMRR